MKPAATCILILAAMLFSPLMPVYGAFALPSEETAVQEQLDIGALADRYESLNSLGSSLTEEEGVVIETRIGVLTSVNRALNDSEVRFTGEVVGDMANAGAMHKWINMQGSADTVISIYVSDEQAALVQNMGNYHTVGTSLKIAGTYHIACPEHQGELDVHARSIEVVDNGGPIIHLLEHGRLSTAFFLCFIAVAVLGLFLYTRHVIGGQESS